MLLILAVFVIYMILGVLYESFIHPITILTGLPFAAFGALVTLAIVGLDLSSHGLVGIIMLIGIVERDAIMMIDFAIEAQREKGTTPAVAIVEACSVCFRPIMMTTMAALMGAILTAVRFGPFGLPDGLDGIHSWIISLRLVLHRSWLVTQER